MAARFEGNKGGRALCHFARLTQGVDFGVRFARFDVEALPDNLAAVCDNAADARIGRSGKRPKAASRRAVSIMDISVSENIGIPYQYGLGRIRLCGLF